MLSINKAADIVKKHLPGCVLKCCVLYKDLYIFVAFTNDPDEGQMDPFYSVHIKTGKFDEFPFLNHSSEVSKLLSNPLKVFE